jgi:hypothetical protein
MRLAAMVPPIIADALREAREPWRGTLYPSWHDAVAAAGSYEDDLVNRFRVARAARLAHNCERPASVLNLTAVAIGAAALAVTDFGGGALGLRRRGALH